MEAGSLDISKARRGTRNPHLQGVQSCYAILPWLLYNRRASLLQLFPNQREFRSGLHMHAKAGMYLVQSCEKQVDADER